jgi:hypothetical protein
MRTQSVNRIALRTGGRPGRSTTETAAYWIFGVALGGAIAIAIGKPLVEERGRRIIPLVVLGGALAGLFLGWALNGYIDYVRTSATTRQ